MPATPVFHAGRFGNAAVNGNPLAIIKWSINPQIKLEEFKNSNSGVIPQREGTFQDADGELTVDFDFANNPFQSPTNLTIGALITNLNLYLRQTALGSLDGPHWIVSNAIIESTPQDLNVDGKIGTNFKWKASGGTITAPTP